MADGAATPMHRDESSLALRRRGLVCRRVGQWLAIWCFVWASIAVGWRIKVYRLRTETARLAEWERASEPLRRAEADLSNLQVRLEQLDRHDALVARLEPAMHPAQLLGLISRAAAIEPPQVAVSELRLATQPDERVYVRIDGRCVDEPSVERFVTSLKDAAVFERIEVQLVASTGTPNVEAQQFSAEGLLSREP